MLKYREKKARYIINYDGKSVFLFVYSFVLTVDRTAAQDKRSDKSDTNFVDIHIGARVKYMKYLMQTNKENEF